MTEPEITVRPLKKADCEQVRELFRSTYLAYGEGGGPGLARGVAEYVEQSLAEDLADPFTHYMSGPRTCFFVAESSGEFAGMLGIDHWEGDGAIAHLRRVAVRQDFRRRGIGRRLMRHAEAWAAAHGYRSMRFYTVELLTEAIAMYESLGYRLVAKHDFGPVMGRESEKPLEAHRA